MVKRKEKTPESREDDRGSPLRRSSRIGNVRGVVRQGVEPVRGRSGAQRRAKSKPTSATLPQKTQGTHPGANGRAAEAGVAAGVIADVVAAAVVVAAVAAVAADTATGVKTEEIKGSSLAEQPGQLLGK